MRLVPDQGNDHRVEVEEEHDKMETELDEGFLLREREMLVSARTYKEM